MIIGLDVGGTNIDIVAIENGTVIDFGKFEITSNIMDSVLNSLERFIALKYKNQIERIVLSTTITTNAIVQQRLDKVGMIIEPGIGAKPDNFMCGDINIILDGYINNRGISVKMFDKKVIENAVLQFKNNNIDSIGIVTKFSIRNPQHELQIYNYLKNADFKFLSMGHRISGKLNFPRRVYSTYLNSAVYSSFNTLFKAISTFFSQHQIPLDKVYIQKPDGGIINISSINDFPIMSILSGPAASAQGAYILAKPACDSITIDIGGTTTDISFISNGQLILEQYGAKIGEYPTLVRAIYSRSIGLGGDSVINYQNKNLTVGPETIKTSHNKNIITFGEILEYLNDKNNQFIKSKLEAFADIHGISVDFLCKSAIKYAVLRIKTEIQNCIDYINNTPVYTINRLIYKERFLPEKIILVGGPAKLIKPYLENELSFKVILPHYYLVANAIGCALGSITKEYNLIADTDQRILSIPELGIYMNISADFDLKEAKNLLAKEIIDNEKNVSCDDIDIVEQSSFNMIRNYRFCGKIIKIKAQLKPKLQELSHNTKEV